MRITLAKNEGLATVGGPHVLEWPGVPEGLVEEQWHSNRMAGRAFAIHQDDTNVRVDFALMERNMAL